MSQIHVEASADIPASPAAVYAVLSDYRNGHPHILPKHYFPSLEVESGGQGAGTIFNARTRVGGQERQWHMQVSEPEPGRVLMESDTASDLFTTFTHEPISDGQHTHLTIASTWEARRGLAGFIERWLTPPAMRRVYRAELRQIADYMQSQGAPAASTGRS
ncbi:MAG TPA: SRPBCC family protein [Ktedonobacterales bacterium]